MSGDSSVWNSVTIFSKKLIQRNFYFVIEEYPIICTRRLLLYSSTVHSSNTAAHIQLTMKGALPTTLHMLFCDLVLCCIVRERKTREPNASLPNLSSLNELLMTLKLNLAVLVN